MGVEVRAVHSVTASAADGSFLTVFACVSHIVTTVQRLAAVHRSVAVASTNDPIHGCKGCLDDWPKDGA